MPTPMIFCSENERFTFNEKITLNFLIVRIYDELYLMLSTGRKSLPPPSALVKTNKILTLTLLGKSLVD